MRLVPACLTGGNPVPLQAGHLISSSANSPRLPSGGHRELGENPGGRAALLQLAAPLRWVFGQEICGSPSDNGPSRAAQLPSRFNLTNQAYRAHMRGA